MVRYPELKGRAILFLLLLWFLWFSNMCVRVVFSPILPLLEDEFAITHARASSLFMFQSAGYGISMFFSGLFSGRFGYKRSIMVCLTLASVLFFLIPFVKVFSLLYIFTFILGLAVGIYLPSAIPLITENFAEKDWGKSIAIHDSAASVSIFSIPLIAIFLLHFFQWRGIFTVFAIISLLGAIIFYFTCDEIKISHSQKNPVGDLIRMRSLWIMGALFTFAAGANLGIYSIIPLYLTKELSLSIGYANTLLGISRLGGIVVAILSGFLVDRIDLRKVLFVITFLTGALTVFLGIASVRYVGIALFLQAVLVTGFFPVGLVAIARMFNREMKSMATGLILTIAIALGVGVIPYFLGVSGDLVSFKFGIAIFGILVTLSSGLVFYLKGFQ